MAQLGKRLKATYAGFDSAKSYDLDEAIKIIKDNAKAKFDETIDIALIFCQILCCNPTITILRTPQTNITHD